MVAALRSEPATRHRNILVIFGEDNLPPVLANGMVALAQAQPWWNATVAVTGAPRSMEGVLVFPTLAALSVWLAGARVEEIWVCRMFHVFEKTVLDMFPGADLVFVDNGLASYVTKEVYRDAGPGDLRSDEIRSGDLARLKAVHLLLGDVLGAPGHFPPHAVRAIQGQSYVRTMQDLLTIPFISREVERVQHVQRGRRVAAVVGSSLYRLGALDRGTELATYAQATRWLIDEGYTVIWKDHIRVDPPFGPAIGAALVDQESLHIVADQGVPVEALACAIGIDVAVSISSTALLTLGRFFGAEGLLLAPQDVLCAAQLPPHMGLLQSIFRNYNGVSGKARNPAEIN